MLNREFPAVLLLKIVIDSSGVNSLITEIKKYFRLSSLLKYELNDFEGIYFYINKALEIKSHQKTYNNEVFSWNETPYDLLAIACYNLNKKEEALNAINHALEISPYDERLLNNKQIIIDSLNI